jgi:hypothetical protein
MLATVWGVEVRANEPFAAIRAIPGTIDQARSSGQRLIIPYQGRALLWPLAALRRYDAVAVLDGASTTTTIRPALAAEAVAVAREALGEDDYAVLCARGRSFSLAELEDYLLQLASDLS